MLAAERIIEIEKRVLQNGKVTVLELADLFQVSPDLIRKDLRKFEHHELIQRVHGGAMLKRKISSPTSINDRINLHINEKKHIAQKAIELIDDKSVIFLDISSVSYYIAELLKNSSKIFTVITNMLAITQLLAHSEHIQVISIGGELDRYLGGYIDGFAQTQVKHFITDIAFVGTGGIDTQSGNLSIHNIADGKMKEAIISMAKDTYIVASSEHFLVDGRYVFETLNHTSGIITDATITEDIIAACQKAEINLIY